MPHYISDRNIILFTPQPLGIKTTTVALGVPLGLGNKTTVVSFRKELQYMVGLKTTTSVQ